MLNSDECRRLILGAAPEGFFEATFQCMSGAYLLAHGYCTDNLPRPEARDLVGYLRRAQFEAAWRKAASAFPGVTARVRQNRARNCHHTRVVLGGKVVLTESAVNDPSELVRVAHFRNRYAREAQLNLFPAMGTLPGEEDFEEDPEDAVAAPDGGPKLYAVLLHGHEKDRPDVPAFARLAVPNEDGSAYLATIDMTATLQAALAATKAAATPVETVIDTAQPKLKSKVKKA